MDDITNDKLITMMYESISKHPNGTYFYWSTSILNRSKLMNLKDGNGHRPFDDSSRFPHLFGLSVKWNRTDDKIYLEIMPEIRPRKCHG